jgi:uncharacterized membrane protein
MSVYPWVVIAHVVFVIVSFGAHGTSAFAMLQARKESDRTRLAAVLDLSTASLTIAGVSLLVAVVLGIIAAMMGGHFGQFWPWASIAVVVIAFGAMTPIGATPMNAVRKVLAMPVRGDKPTDSPRQPGTDAELRAAQSRLRPELLASIGIVAIAVLVWLMEAKPF